MTVQSQMTEVLNFRTDAVEQNYPQELLLKKLASLRENARKLVLKREQFAVLEMINTILAAMHREDQVFAYRYKGEIYVNSKNVSKYGYHSTEELIGQNYPQSTWDSMERLTLWKNTYNIYCVEVN